MGDAQGKAMRGGKARQGLGLLRRPSCTALACMVLLATLLLWLVGLPAALRGGGGLVHIAGLHATALTAKEYASPVSEGGAPAAEDPYARFVRVTDGRLTLRGQPFRVAGFNSYFMMTRAADAYTRRADVDAVFDAAAGLNATVLRTWAFTDGEDEWNALQPRQGVLREAVLRDGLDWVLAEAGRRGLRVLLTLTNYDPAFGGMEAYVRWAGGTSICDFYREPRIVGAFKDYVAAILLRRNVWTGLRYRDDPTILGWELANEPLCPGDDSGDVLHAWVAELAAFVKALDPGHLVTVGYHGYYGASTPHQWALNPSAPGWLSQQPLPYDAVCEGADFVRNNALLQVDLVNLHVWPDNWLQCNTACKIAWTQSWLAAHINDAERLGKPVLFGEVGALRGGRHELYALVLGEVERAARAGRPVAGALLWSLGSPAYPDYDGYTLYADDAAAASRPRPALPRPTSYMAALGERLELRNWGAMVECVERRAMGKGAGIPGALAQENAAREAKRVLGLVQAHGLAAATANEAAAEAADVAEAAAAAAAAAAGEGAGGAATRG